MEWPSSADFWRIPETRSRVPAPSTYSCRAVTSSIMAEYAVSLLPSKGRTNTRNQRTCPRAKAGRNSASNMVRASTLACHLESTPIRSAGSTYSGQAESKAGSPPFRNISRQARLAYLHFPWRSTMNSAAGDSSSKAARSRSYTFDPIAIMKMLRPAC